MRRYTNSFLYFRANDTVEISSKIPIGLPVSVVSRHLFDQEQVVLADCDVAVEEGSRPVGGNVLYASPTAPQVTVSSHSGPAVRHPAVVTSIADLMREEAALLRAEEEVDVLSLADPNEEIEDRFAPVRVIEI